MTGVDNVVDFGLNYVKGQVFGSLRNDVGAGIAGVDIVLEGNGTARRGISGDNGSFQFRGLAEGSYTINSVLESYPAGYNLQDISEKTLEVKPGAPVHVELKVSALRSVAGVVSAYDTMLLRPVPQAGVMVRISELGIQTKTDATGHYIFRHLPAGKFLVTAGDGTSSRGLEVEVPAQPGEIRNFDFLLRR